MARSTVWLVFFVLYTVLLGVSVIACCGDPSRDDVIGRATRFANLLPSRVAHALRGFLPSRVFKCCGRWYDYVLDEPNPVCQIVYLLMLSGGYGLALRYAYPLVPSPSLPSFHRDLGLVAVSSCLASFVLVCRTSPGYIVDAASVVRHDNYETDGVLYFPDRVCRTTGLPKLARSKYCRISRVNVARFDHFCPWLNAPIGEENYRYFLLFISLHTSLLAYGGYASIQLLRDFAHREELWTAVFYNAVTLEARPATTVIVLQYLLSHQRPICALLIICGIMGVVVAAFLFFHLWLLSRGLTSNEYFKRLALSKRKHAPAPEDDDDDDDDVVGCVSSHSSSAVSPPTTTTISTVPEHAYNRGIVLNLMEVAWPLSQRAAAKTRVAKYIQEEAANAASTTPAAATKASPRSPTSKGKKKRR